MKLVKEHINFERGLKPKQAMDIGMGIPSKMGGKEKGYTALFNNGKWSIEKYKNLFPSGDYSLIVINDDDFITDYTIMYDDGSVAFDNPYKLPSYIKNKVRKLYKQIKPLKEHNFQRGLDPKDAMDIGNAINILGNEPGSEFKAFPIYHVTDKEKRYVFPVNRMDDLYQVKIAFGKNKDKMKFAAKFTPPFGKFWGMEIKSYNERELSK